MGAVPGSKHGARPDCLRPDLVNHHQGHALGYARHGQAGRWDHMAPAPVVGIGGPLHPTQLRAVATHGAAEGCVVRVLDFAPFMATAIWQEVWQRVDAPKMHVLSVCQHCLTPRYLPVTNHQTNRASIYPFRLFMNAHAFTRGKSSSRNTPSVRRRDRSASKRPMPGNGQQGNVGVNHRPSTQAVMSPRMHSMISQAEL